jgi:hypothetical protein
MRPDAELGEDNVRAAATRLAIAHIVDIVCPFFFDVGASSLIYARSMASGSSKLKKRGRGNTDMGGEKVRHRGSAMEVDGGVSAVGVRGGVGRGCANAVYGGGGRHRVRRGFVWRK